MNNVAIDELYDLYIRQRKSMNQIAKESGIAVGRIHKLIHLYGIQARKQSESNIGRKLSKEHKEKLRLASIGKTITEEHKKILSELSKGRIGEKSPRFKGGRSHRADGYKQIKILNHPYANKEGYVMEHRHIIENSIGRYLQDDEIVHHKNGIRNDNRIENLELMTFKEHAGYHMKKRHIANKERLVK